MDRLFVQQLRMALDAVAFHRYIANSMTNLLKSIDRIESSVEI